VGPWIDSTTDEAALKGDSSGAERLSVSATSGSNGASSSDINSTLLSAGTGASSSGDARTEFVVAATTEASIDEVQLPGSVDEALSIKSPL
jgi:hypothetical protein